MGVGKKRTDGSTDESTARKTQRLQKWHQWLCECERVRMLADRAGEVMRWAGFAFGATDLKPLKVSYGCYPPPKHFQAYTVRLELKLSLLLSYIAVISPSHHSVWGRLPSHHTIITPLFWWTTKRQGLPLPGLIESDVSATFVFCIFFSLPRSDRPPVSKNHKRYTTLLSFTP